MGTSVHFLGLSVAVSLCDQPLGKGEDGTELPSCSPLVPSGAPSVSSVALLTVSFMFTHLKRGQVGSVFQNCTLGPWWLCC